MKHSGVFIVLSATIFHLHSAERKFPPLGMPQTNVNASGVELSLIKTLNTDSAKQISLHPRYTDLLLITKKNNFDIYDIKKNTITTCDAVPKGEKLVGAQWHPFMQYVEVVYKKEVFSGTLALVDPKSNSLSHRVKIDGQNRNCGFAWNPENQKELAIVIDDHQSKKLLRHDGKNKTTSVLPLDNQESHLRNHIGGIQFCSNIKNSVQIVFQNKDGQFWIWDTLHKVYRRIVEDYNFGLTPFEAFLNPQGTHCALRLEHWLNVLLWNVAKHKAEAQIEMEYDKKDDTSPYEIRPHVHWSNDGTSLFIQTYNRIKWYSTAHKKVIASFLFGFENNGRISHSITKDYLAVKNADGSKIDIYNIKH
jgi:hypothetical protein